MLLSTLIVICLIRLLVLFFIQFISAIFVFIKSLFKILFLLSHSMLLFVSLNERFYFALRFLLVRINCSRNVFRKISIRYLKLLGLGFLKFLKLLYILLVQVKLVKVVLLVFFLLLMHFLNQGMWFFSLVPDHVLSLGLFIIVIQSLTNLSVIQVHDINSGPISRFIFWVCEWILCLITSSSVILMFRLFVTLRHKEIIFLF